jgi:hypothetical protein
MCVSELLGVDGMRSTSAYSLWERALGGMAAGVVDGDVGLNFRNESRRSLR